MATARQREESTLIENRQGYGSGVLVLSRIIEDGVVLLAILAVECVRESQFCLIWRKIWTVMRLDALESQREHHNMSA